MWKNQLPKKKRKKLRKKALQEKAGKIYEQKSLDELWQNFPKKAGKIRTESLQKIPLVKKNR